MRFFYVSIVIIISLPLHYFSPSLAFSSRHRGRGAARARERRQDAVGTGNEHHGNGFLDDNHNSHAVKDEFVLRRKKSIAAAVMGAATAQFSATKAFAVVGLTIAGSVDNINSVQDSPHIRDETFESSVVVNKPSILKVAPSSRISLSLPSNILADVAVDTTIVEMLEKIASDNEKAQAESIDEAGLKQKIQDLKGKALEDVLFIEKQAVQEKSTTDEESIASGQTTRVVEDDKLKQQKGSADLELREQGDADQTTAERAEQQEAEQATAEQRARDETEALMKEQQEAERVATEQRTQSEGSDARFREQQEAERVAEQARDEEIALLRKQLEAERQEAETVAAEQKAREEAIAMLTKQQEAERVATEAARVAEQEKLQQEREVARIEAERLAEEKLVAKLEKEEKTLIESISKLEAQVLKQEQESAKIEVERRRQEEVLAKLEAEEKTRTEQIERIDAQVLKLEKEADEAKVVLERLRKVEQSREDEANKAMEARKAIVAKLDSIKLLPSKTLSDFNSRSPQLQGSLDLFKAKLPSAPSLEGIKSLELSKLKAVSTTSSSGKMLELQTSYKDMINDVPEYAVLWAASAVLALFVVVAGLREEDNENGQNGYNDDMNTSTPYGLTGKGGMYPPTTSTFSGSNSNFSSNSFRGVPKQSGSVGSTKTSFGGSPPSQGYGTSGMNSRSGFASMPPSANFQPPLKGSTMGGNGAGSGFTQTSKGGSFGGRTSFGGGGGGLPTSMPFGKQVGKGGGIPSTSNNFSNNQSSFVKGPMKGSSNSFGSNQVAQTGSPSGMAFGQKGGGGSNMATTSKFAAKGSSGFVSAQGGGLGLGPGLSAGNMPFGQKGGGGLSSVSKTSSGSGTSSPPFPTGPKKGPTSLSSMQGGGQQSQKLATSFSGNPPPFTTAESKGLLKSGPGFQRMQKGNNEGGGGDGGFSSASKSSSGNPPPFPTGPMKGSSGFNPGSGFTGSPKTFGRTAYKKG